MSTPTNHTDIWSAMQADSRARGAAHIARLTASTAPVAPGRSLQAQKGNPDWRADVAVSRYSTQRAGCSTGKLATCGCACHCHNGPRHCGSLNHWYR